MNDYSDLCVANGLQFGFEELREEMIDLQPALAGQRDRLRLTIEHSVLLQSFIGWLKFVPDLDAELAAKIGQLERPGLELQNHLADQSLFRRQPQRTPERQLAVLQQPQVLFEIVGVLEMDAVEVG